MADLAIGDCLAIVVLEPLAGNSCIGANVRVTTARARSEINHRRSPQSTPADDGTETVSIAR